MSRLVGIVQRNGPTVACGAASVIQKDNKLHRQLRPVSQFQIANISGGDSMRQRSDYPTFSDTEIQRRHNAIYGLMEQECVDALLFYGSGRYASDIYWLSDWPSSREAYLLMQAGREPVILMQLFNHYPMARVMSWIKDVRWARANTTNSVTDLFHARG